MLHLAIPIDTNDPLLVSTDERAAFLAMLPRHDLDPWNIHPGETLIGVRFSDDVRKAARRLRDDGMWAAARKRLNAPAETEVAA